MDNAVSNGLAWLTKQGDLIVHSHVFHTVAGAVVLMGLLVWFLHTATSSSNPNDQSKK